MKVKPKKIITKEAKETKTTKKKKVLIKDKAADDLVNDFCSPVNLFFFSRF
jgi:hypothetical protein